MNSASDRRKDRRLALNLDVELTPHSSCGTSTSWSGATRNVSAGGVYLQTRPGRPIQNGAAVFLKIAIPNHAKEHADPLVLHCEGTVYRIEKLSGEDNAQGTPMGVAVKFDNRPNIEFQSLDNLL